MMRLLRAIVAALLLGLLALPAEAAALKGVALVIGESKYGDGWPALTNPRNDARAMDDMLGDLGFDVDRVLDGDEQELQSRIAEFVEKAKSADVALIYYSGHGIEAGGEDYLVPVDADLSSPQQAGRTLIPISALLDQLSRTVPVTIVLLDACRTNGLPTGTLIQPLGANTPLIATDAGLAVVRGPTPVAAAMPADELGTIIGFAASPGQSALDGDPNGNSPYAAALLKHFGAGGYSFADLMTMVSEEVYLKTGARQLPWVNSSLRRVLTFGAPIPDANPDEAAIRDGRRQLLLTIAATPEATRATVETIAASEGVPLDELYGMLKVLGVDTSSDATTLQQKLEEGAKQLRDFLAKAPGGVKTDAELQRLTALADEAQSEGAMQLALTYRAEASARADQLDKTVDANEAALKADRMQIAQTYAEYAQTAELNFDYATAAAKFEAAYEQVARWDVDSAASYRLSLADALSNLGYFSGDPDALQRAVATYRAVLEMRPRSQDPENWAVAQNNLSATLEHIGERSLGSSELQEAADAIRASLEVYTPQFDPTRWAMAETNLANILTTIGNRTADTAMIREAITGYRRVLDADPGTSNRYQWAMTQYDMGTSLTELGQQDKSDAELNDGLAALRAALQTFDAAQTQSEWATTQYEIALNLKSQGDSDTGTELYDQAIAAVQSSIWRHPVAAYPMAWANAMTMLGSIQQAKAQRLGDEAVNAAAIGSYRQALTQLTAERAPAQWALTKRSLALALVAFVQNHPDPAPVEQALAAIDDAMKVETEAGHPAEWANDQEFRGEDLLMVALLTRSLDTAEQARQSLLLARDKFREVGKPQDEAIASALSMQQHVVDILTQPQGD